MKLTIDPAYRDPKVESIATPERIQITKAQYDALIADRTRRDITNSYYKYVLLIVL